MANEVVESLQDVAGEVAAPEIELFQQSQHPKLQRGTTLVGVEVADVHLSKVGELGQTVRYAIAEAIVVEAQVLESSYVGIGVWNLAGKKFPPSWRRRRRVKLGMERGMGPEKLLLYASRVWSWERPGSRPRLGK